MEIIIMEKDAHLIVLEGNAGAGKSFTANLFYFELLLLRNYEPKLYDFVEPARELLSHRYNLSAEQLASIMENKNANDSRLNGRSYRAALFDITNDTTKDRDYISELWCGHVTDLISKINTVPVIIATGPLNNHELIKSIKHTPSITKVHLIHITSPDESRDWTGRSPITGDNIPKLEVEYTFINPGKHGLKPGFMALAVRQYIDRFFRKHPNTEMEIDSICNMAGRKL